MKRLSKQKLDHAIKQHMLWLHSHGKEGEKADFRDTSLTKADLSGKILHKANLRNADLRGVIFTETDLREADLRKANLSGANLTEADLRKADVRGASLGLSNKTGRKMRLRHLDGANLSRADLRQAKLSKANLEGVNLSRANLTEANLSISLLSGCNLSNSNLSKSNLEGADLFGADLFSADLTEAILNVADLSEADLNDAILHKTLLGGTKFSHTTLNKTLFDSKYQLKQLASPLTETQLQQAIFLDEKQTGNANQKKLTIKLDTPEISPINLSYLLKAIQSAYNNLFYLCSTKETNLSHIQQNLTPYFNSINRENELKIISIQKNELAIELSGDPITIDALKIIVSNIVKHTAQLAKLQGSGKKTQHNFMFDNDANDLRYRNEISQIVGTIPMDTLLIKKLRITNSTVLANREELLSQSLLSLINIVYIKILLNGYSIEIN